MLRPTVAVLVVLTFAPATVHAFDHHHHHHHSGGHSSGGGCSGSHSDSSPSHADESEGADAPASPSASPTPSSPTEDARRVFVTKALRAGDLGGIAGADALCEEAANGQGFSGTYRAWLSDETTNAIDRIADVGPWYTADDALAFTSKADLASPPYAPITDELGDPAHAVWSGSDTHGRATGEDCNGWRTGTSDAQATTGEDAAADATWGGGGLVASCSIPRAILCIGQ